MVFTGLVQYTGEAEWLDWPQTLQLAVRVALSPDDAATLQVGDSVAVDGVCLTVVRVEADELAAGATTLMRTLTFDVHPETLARTTLSWSAHWCANIELAVTLARAAHARVGGHLVSGHVHGCAHLVSAAPAEDSDSDTGCQDWLVTVPMPLPLGYVLLHKGSIALNGVSLTIAQVIPGTNGTVQVRLALVPHTLAVTNLGLVARDHAPMNAEFDRALPPMIDRAQQQRDMDRRGMDAALEAARHVVDSAPPEPPVGAAFFSAATGQLLATGATGQRQRRDPCTDAPVHAELDALLKLDHVDYGSDEEEDALVLYVTMEPCHDMHPESGGPAVPCGPAIVLANARRAAAGVPCVTRVVYAVADPDPRERGQGAQWLRDRGVACDQLPADAPERTDAEMLYLAHGHHRRTGRPWVTWRPSNTTTMKSVTYRAPGSDAPTAVAYPGPALWKKLGREGVVRAEWTTDAWPPADQARYVCELALPRADMQQGPSERMPWNRNQLVFMPPGVDQDDQDAEYEHYLVHVPAIDPEAPLQPASAEEARAAIAAGELVLVADDEDRENEVDLVGDARVLDVQDLSFFIRHTSGLVCAVLTAERALELGLAPQRPPSHWQDDGSDAHAKLAPQFTVTVDAIPTKTGVSADERLLTLGALADPGICSSAAFRAGAGHVLPLVARAGGLAERRGHTEATMSLLAPRPSPSNATGAKSFVMTRADIPSPPQQPTAAMNIDDDFDKQAISVQEEVDSSVLFTPQSSSSSSSDKVNFAMSRLTSFQTHVAATTTTTTATTHHHPVGVLAELRSANGRGMMRRDEARRFAREHGLLFTTVAALADADAAEMAATSTTGPLRSPVLVRELARAPLTLHVAASVAFDGATHDSEGWEVRLFSDSLRATEAAPHRVLVLDRPGAVVSPVAPWRVRIHSECWWSESLGSKACDCKAQLDAAIALIHEVGRGIIVFPAHHEGRGIGLVHKARAYAVAADLGLDTFAANRAIARPDDARDYRAVRPLLEALQLPGLCAPGRILLWTRNPDKAAALGDWLAGTEPLDVGATSHNAAYLEAKNKAWLLQPTGVPTMNLGC